MLKFGNHTCGSSLGFHSLDIPAFITKFWREFSFFLLALSTKLSQDPFLWMGLVLIHLHIQCQPYVEISVRLLTLGRLCTVSLWNVDVFKMEAHACFTWYLQSEYSGVSFHPKVIVFNLILAFVFILYSCQVRYLFTKISNIFF